MRKADDPRCYVGDVVEATETDDGLAINRSVPSALPETMRCPSGPTATLFTSCPVSGWPTGWPVAASHGRTVWSLLPETIRLPSGLNATLNTQPWSPVIDAMPVPSALCGWLAPLVIGEPGYIAFR
jgi:hypothetical protein